MCCGLRIFVQKYGLRSWFRLNDICYTWSLPCCLDWFAFQTDLFCIGGSPEWVMQGFGWKKTFRPILCLLMSNTFDSPSLIFTGQRWHLFLFFRLLILEKWLIWRRLGSLIRYSFSRAEDSKFIALLVCRLKAFWSSGGVRWPLIKMQIICLRMNLSQSNLNWMLVEYLSLTTVK